MPFVKTGAGTAYCGANPGYIILPDHDFYLIRSLHLEVSTSAVAGDRHWQVYIGDGGFLPYKKVAWPYAMPASMTAELDTVRGDASITTMVTAGIAHVTAPYDEIVVPGGYTVWGFEQGAQDGDALGYLTITYDIWSHISESVVAVRNV